MLLSAEAAKAAQKANMDNSLETAQHALQDKQQVTVVLVSGKTHGISPLRLTF